MDYYHFTCFFCGGALTWDSTEMACDVSSDYDDTDFATVELYHCSKCGRDYEIFEPNEEQREKEYRDFWQEG